MKLSEIFHSFGSRIASLKSQGKAGEARALILERDKAVTQAGTSPPVASTPPAPVSATPPMPTTSNTPAMDHTATIANLSSKVSSLESRVSFLTAENSKLQAAMGAGKQPGPTPSAQAASLQGEERLAQLVLEVDKCRSDMAVNAFMTLHGAEVAALMMGNRNLMQYTLAFPNWARFAKKN